MSPSSQGGKRNRNTRPRHAWVGLFLGLFPGLGQLYVGMPRRAAAAAAAIAVLLIGILAASLLPPESMAIGLLQLGLVGAFWIVWLAFALDAAIAALRSGDFEPGRYNHAAVYLAVALAWGGAYLVFGKIEGALSQSARYMAESGSMEPTLSRNERIFGHKGYYAANEVMRGDLVAIRKPGNEDEAYLLRVIGLPGDSVQVVDGIPRINGQPVGRQSVDPAAAPGAGRNSAFTYFVESLPAGATYMVSRQFGAGGVFDNTPASEVPGGHVYILGDNRDNATDSRVFGPVPIEKLESRLTFIYWPEDKSRIGDAVQPGG